MARSRKAKEGSATRSQPVRVVTTEGVAGTRRAEGRVFSGRPRHIEAFCGALPPATGAHTVVMLGVKVVRSRLQQNGAVAIVGLFSGVDGRVIEVGPVGTPESGPLTLLLSVARL